MERRAGQGRAVEFRRGFDICAFLNEETRYLFVILDRCCVERSVAIVIARFDVCSFSNEVLHHFEMTVKRRPSKWGVSPATSRIDVCSLAIAHVFLSPCFAARPTMDRQQIDLSVPLRRYRSWSCRVA